MHGTALIFNQRISKGVQMRTVKIILSVLAVLLLPMLKRFAR
jgi:hypothetical protein